MVRAFVRRFGGALPTVAVVGAAVLALTLSACTAPDVPESSAPQVPTISSPPPSSTEPPAATPSTTWTPPADPTAQGPTAAPELPEVESALDEPAELSNGVVVSVDSVSTMTVTPETPGEYAGSAVVVRVSVHNQADAVQNVDSAVVSLNAEDGEVGIATTAGPNQPLRGDVPVGGTVTGSYVFMLEPAEQRDVIVSVNYAAGEPIVKFTGSTT